MRGRLNDEGASTVMGIVINTNLQSLNAQRLLGKNTKSLSGSFEKLASGFKINRASDDAAGLQISESLRSQIRGSQKALDNVQDGVNLLNVLDGTLDTVTQNLQRIRELVVQGANDTYGAGQRSAISSEIGQLAVDLTRIAAGTQFNGRNLLDGSIATFFLQVGANSNTAVDRINLASVGGINPFSSISATALGLGTAGSALGLQTNGSALAALSAIDTALTTINNRRAIVGAAVNRLESASNNLSISIENLSSSESRIRNVDVAKESAELTRNQILQQASATVLSQANQLPQLALNLLRGQ